MEPLVSVIIPTYMRAVEFLARAVSSVRAQTYPNVEIIVIDDSPSDYPLRDAVGHYMRSIVSERILYTKNERNLGGSLSRNRGIELAHGQFITFLDDDDEYMEHKIQRQLDFMLQTGCDLSFSNMIMYSVDGRVVDFRSYADIPSFDNEALLKYHLQRHLTGTPTFMFRAEKLREIGGFEDAKMGQEFYLMLKAIERGLKVRYLDDCGVKVYKHADGGISQGPNKIHGERALYRFKRTHFPRLSRRERMFVRFRHWAVMTVAYRRNRMPVRMLGAAAAAFFASPLDFAGEGIGFVSKVRAQSKRQPGGD